MGAPSKIHLARRKRLRLPMPIIREDYLQESNLLKYKNILLIRGFSIISTLSAEVASEKSGKFNSKEIERFMP